MPITLLVRAATPSGAEPPPLTFDGSRVVVGRSEASDVRLPDASVSARHASIRVAGQGREAHAGYAIYDEGSANGTFVGGVRVLPHTARALRNGDFVRVGNVWLEVRIDQRPATANLGAATRDVALFIVEEAMRGVSSTTPALRVVEGPDYGAEVPLEDGVPVIVGRGESCQLPLADPDASREHVVVVRRGGTYTVRDLRSKNGAFLGDTAVSADRDVPWRPHFMLRLGQSVLALHEPLARALAEVERLADEILPTGAPPPEPPPPSSLRSPSLPPPEAVPPSSLSIPLSVAPAESLPASGVPIAPAPPASPALRKPNGSWSPVDIGVAILAIVTATLSITALIWLLRG